MLMISFSILFLLTIISNSKVYSLLSYSKLSKSTKAMQNGKDHNQKEILSAKLSIPTLPILSSPNKFKDSVASLLGFTMGFGAISLYSPIVLNLLKSKNSDGFSIMTWILNVTGTMLAISYPFKKGFPVSTYVELITVLFQSVGILGLVCFYQGLTMQYLFGIIPVMFLYIAFMFYPSISPTFINSLQLMSITLCTYANIPQIILTFQKKTASWSWITAALSMAGCLVRIFTTLQLTKDKLALIGYIIGFVTNGILFGQVIFYNYLLK